MHIVIKPAVDWHNGIILRLSLAEVETAPGSPGKIPGAVQLAGEGRAVVSLGAQEKLSEETLRQTGGGVAKWLRQYKVEKAAVSLEDLEGLPLDQPVRAFCEGLLLGDYRFTQWKTKNNEKVDTTVELLAAGDNAAAAEQLRQADIIAAAVNLARDLGNQPPNVLNPVTLAQRAVQIAGESGLKVRVLDDKELAAMGAGALVAVGKASPTPARLIVLEYPGKGKGAGQPPVVVVGKGITFDTGGYSIKAKLGMVGMKFDMDGGAAVIGLMQAVAHLQPLTPVVGIIPAAENMISGDAYRPNDVVTTLSGQTVEIISTDAEGRMVLADGLTFAQREYSPRTLIDIATLTGGAMVALGRVRGALMGNDPGLQEALVTAGERAHERLWRLPLDEEYFDLIKSDTADFKNSAGVAVASAIVGGTFLKQFVDEDTSWAHIDIAAVHKNTAPAAYGPAGASGFGVRLLLEYIRGMDG